MLPDGDGLEVLRLARARPNAPEVLVITAYGTIDSAVEAVRSGAFDYLTKPIATQKLLLTVDRAIERRTLRSEVSNLRREVGERYSAEGLVAASAAMRRVLDMVNVVAATDSAVLIQGESGTGKELVARAIHFRGARSGRPFIAINCAALPEALLESELFGYAKGAFTGAATERKGLFEEADGGTLLLDEIGDMPLLLQGKLLRVLQEGEIRRVGSASVRRVDVRILASTNRNLQDLIQDGKFREDLFYRLNVIPLVIPPLRDRPDDIVPLCRHFLGALREEARQARPEPFPRRPPGRPAPRLAGQRQGAGKRDRARRHPVHFSRHFGGGVPHDRFARKRDGRRRLLPSACQPHGAGRREGNDHPRAERRPGKPDEGGRDPRHGAEHPLAQDEEVRHRRQDGWVPCSRLGVEPLFHIETKPRVAHSAAPPHPRFRPESPDFPPFFTLPDASLVGMIVAYPWPSGGPKEMGKKVLVVDDANFMRTIVKDTLTPNGFEIVGEATNGAEAVTKYAELKPDLVTMDITMKVKDGLEAAREILAADPNARIVMVTALGQEKMLLDSIALGVRDFVVKPFTKERILSAVEKALG